MRKYEEIKKIVEKEKVDYMFCKGDDSFFKWFVGKNISHSLLFLGGEKPLMFKSPLETFNEENYELINIDEAKELLKKKLGVDTSKVSIKLKKDIREVIDVSSYMNELRSIKEKDELSFIKKACSHTDECITRLIENFKSFRTEKDVEKYIRSYALENDLGLAFDPIVASGSNSRNAHHDNSGILKKGFLVLDLGFTYKGYCSDMTRTFYIGTPSEEEESQYYKVLKSQEKALEMVKASVSFQKIEEKVRDFLGDDNEYFIHSLGHGLGVDVHEKPFKSDILKTNQVITIEPGIYKKQGVRIEDVLIVKNKAEILTKTPKKLINL